MKTKTKKKTITEKCVELGVNQFKFSEILAAYSDCHDDLNAEDRDLNFFSREPITGKEFIAAIGKIIPGYNDFYGEETPAKIVEVFGKDASYFVAREGSPCFYIKPKYLWLNRDTKLAKLADEVSFCGDLGMFRVWFD